MEMQIGELTTVKASLIAAMRQVLSASSAFHDHFALTQATDQALILYPGPHDACWIQRIESIAKQLRIKTERLNVPISMLGELKELEGPFLSLDPKSGRFLFASNDGYRLIESASDRDVEVRPNWTNVELAAYLIESGASSSMLWLRLQGDDETRSGQDSHHVTPIQRFFYILKPDLIDIAAMSILAFVISVLAIGVPVAAQQLVRAVTFGTLYQPIIVLSLTLLLFLSFMAALQVVSKVVAEVIQQRLFARTAADFAQKLPKVTLHELRHAKGPEALNRFLEIVTVQKVVSGFLLDGLAVVFTTVIGMTLLALYHPFLLGYDLLLLLLIAAVILVLGRGGTKTSIRESIEKYRVLAWLQDLARCPLAFRLQGASALAEARTQQLTSDYLNARNKHFRVLLRQVICIFGIQGFASATLLGLGGVLVLQEQMTLGQLVAAELVVAMITGSLAKLAKQIESFFDVMASVEKLGHISDMREEKRGTEVGQSSTEVLAEFPIGAGTDSSSGIRSNRIAKWTLRRGRHLAVVEGSESEKRHLADVLFGIQETRENSGLIFGTAANDLVKEFQRQQVALIRDVEIFSGTLEENIHLGRNHLDHNSVLDAIRAVGLETRIRALPDGVQTILNPDGSPLSPIETVLLIVARGIAGNPQILIIDHLVDQLPDEMARDVLMALQAKNVPWTLLLMTGRQDLAAQIEERVEIR